MANPLTVKNLIDLLSKYPGNLRVVVDGYEGGYEDLQPGRVKVQKLVLDVYNDYEHWGPHDDYEQGDEAPTDVLCLRRSE